MGRIFVGTLPLPYNENFPLKQKSPPQTLCSGRTDLVRGTTRITVIQSLYRSFLLKNLTDHFHNKKLCVFRTAYGAPNRTLPAL